ncbi:MAG TPA: thioredoxin fold domain-containing protein [Steroidobacteraceae bacterium]|jgi:thiol:disulfide interchange protein DsbC
MKRRAVSLALIAAMTLTGTVWAADSAMQQPAAGSISAPGPAAGQAQAAPAVTTAHLSLPKPISASPETLRAVAADSGVKLEDVQPTPVAGIFEVLRGSDILYVTRDGDYAFTGDLYQVHSKANLTEVHRRELRRKLIGEVPESRMVVFAAPHPKYTVTVFTDVDCAYCRAFHKQIAEYNRLGVSVHYLFYPRTGPNTESWHKAEQVWCSADRKTALTRAKLGESIDAKACANTPVAQEYELGKEIGLEGTPGIVAANGTMVGGYLPPDQLVEQLQQLQP